MRSRLWSARRIAAATVALVAVVVTGALLYEEIRVAAGFAADPWRVLPARELADHRFADAAALAIAVGVALLGVWLIVLACAPGRRRRHRLATDPGLEWLRASLDRDSTRAMLRDAALEVSGVTDAEVKVRHRHATVLAVARYGETDLIREQLERRIGAERERLAMVRTPFVTVKVKVPK